jgi:hypothetical protein
VRGRDGRVRQELAAGVALRPAKALGLQIPGKLIGLADEVME